MLHVIIIVSINFIEFHKVFSSLPVKTPLSHSELKSTTYPLGFSW